jgi:foldase protein PrsA
VSSCLRRPRPGFASIRHLLPRRLRIGTAFCAVVAAIGLGACGSDIPGNAVAQVGDASITMAAVHHWLVVANNSSQVSTGVAAPPLPVPPDYTACVAAQRKTSPTDSASALKAVCKQDYESLLTQVVNYLIQTIWIQGEAVDRHISVTPKQVQASFEQERKLSTPPLTTTAELNAFLAKTGETLTDLRWRTRLNLLVNKIEAKVEKAASKVSAASIDSYYKKHLTQFTTPTTRDLHLVETSGAASAAKVKALLAGGSSYATVAPKYSIDATKSAGGKMLGVTATELNAQLSAKVFAAKPGVLSGPIKTAFGYYVFTVDSTAPSSQESLAKATPTIKALIASQQTTAANAALQADFTKKWTARSHCRSGFVVAPSCSNAPKGSTASTGATGATG